MEKLTKEAIKKAIKELSHGKNPETVVRELKKGIEDPTQSSAWKKEFAKRITKIRKYQSLLKGARGAVSIAGLGTIAAGAAVVATWAYPAKKLGEYLGRKSVEQKWEEKLKSKVKQFLKK